MDRLFADAELSAELVAHGDDGDADDWAEGLRAVRSAISGIRATYGEDVLIAVPVAIEAPTGEGG
jgi:hypothetical protein